MSADIGLIGLAVMGQNLVLNMNDHGYTVAVYNRTTSKIDDFLNGPAQGTKVLGAHTLEEFIKKINRPRKVMFMVKAGPAVDALIEQMIPLLEPGDIIIDGGNSHYPDTERRFKNAQRKRGCCLWELASLEERKALAMVHRSCLEVILMLGKS